MKSIKIGILGGIGPEATGKFYLDLIGKMQERGMISKNMDFPQIVINSINAPEPAYGNMKENDLAPYIQGLKELDAIKPDFIVMVCNTIHLFYDRLQSEVDTEIIDLRKAVKQSMMERRITNVTVIGTQSTISLGLYEFEGIRYFNPDVDEMKKLAASLLCFNRGEDKDIQKSNVESIIKRHTKEGSETAILGCTEFAVMLKDSDILKIDTMDILSDTMIDRIVSMRDKAAKSL